MSPLSPISPPFPAYGLSAPSSVGAPELLPNVQGPPDPALASPVAARPAGDSFGSLLGRMVGEVNAKQNAAGEAVAALQSGQNVSLHQAVIAMEEASVSFQLMVEVRNKLLDSYQELMRMQI